MRLVAQVGVAVHARLAPHDAVGLDDALGEAQQHAQRMLGHGLPVAARLVDQQHAGLRARLDVDGVVAGAVAGHDQQVRRAPQQLAGHVVGAGELIARGADLEGVRGGQDGGDRLLGAVVLQPVQPYVRARAQQLREYAVREVFHVEDALSVHGHGWQASRDEELRGAGRPWNYAGRVPIAQMMPPRR